MNTFWLKIAALVVVVVGLIILVNVFSSSEPEPEPRTFWDEVEEDEKRLRAEPEVAEPPKAEQAPLPASEQEPMAEEEPAPQPAPASKRPTLVAKQPTGPAVPQFRELSEIEGIDAERLFNVALQHRKIGRLPGTGFKVMVDCCRQILEKYPDSVYAFKAKRMLRDMPERFRARYKITEEEIDLGSLK